MNELDPNYLLPLWRAVVNYFSRYQPLVQASQLIDPPGPGEATATPTPALTLPVRRAERGSKTGLVNI